MGGLELFILQKGRGIDQNGCWGITGSGGTKLSAESEKEKVWIASAFVSFCHYVYSEILWKVSDLEQANIFPECYLHWSTSKVMDSVD